MADQQPDGTIAAEGEQATPPERPEWLPQNFANPEALVESYKQAQAKISEQGQALSELQHNVQAWQEQQQQAQQPSQETLIEQLSEQTGLDEDQLSAIAWLAGQAAQSAVQQAAPPASAQDRDSELLAKVVDFELTKKYDDWDDYKEQVGQIIEQNPYLLPVGEDTSPNQIVASLEHVYKHVKMSAELEQGAAVNDAAQAQRNVRQQAQTMTGQGQRPATQTADEEWAEQIRKARGGGYADS